MPELTVTLESNVPTNGTLTLPVPGLNVASIVANSGQAFINDVKKKVMFATDPVQKTVTVINHDKQWPKGAVLHVTWDEEVLEGSGSFLPLEGGVMTGGIDWAGASGTVAWRMEPTNPVAGGFAFTIQGMGPSDETRFSIIGPNSVQMHIAFAAVYLLHYHQLDLCGVKKTETSDEPRWSIKLYDNTEEMGGNTGSNFSIMAFADGSQLSGAPLSTPLHIERATGKTTFSAMPSIPGGVAGNTITTDGAGALSWATSAAVVGPECADDAAAGVAGVPIGGLYHTSGNVKIRLS